MSSDNHVRLRNAAVPPNVITPRGPVNRAEIIQFREHQAEQQRRIAEENARKAAEEAERRRKEQEAAAAASSRRNPNVFFKEGVGWSFIVTPTHEDPEGRRPVSRSDIDLDFLKQNPTSQLAKDLKRAEDKALTDFIFSTFKHQKTELAKEGKTLTKQKLVIHHDTGLVDIKNYFQSPTTAISRDVSSDSDAGYRFTGDPRAISKVRYEAIQQLSQEYAKNGGIITQQDIDRRTAELLETKYKNGVPISNTTTDFSYLNTVFAGIDAENRRVASLQKAQQDAEVQKMIDEMRELGYGKGQVIINEDGSRTYQFVPLAGRKQYQYVATDPMNPFKIEKVEVATDRVINVKAPFSEPSTGLAGLAAGFYNTFENTVKSFMGIPEKVISGKDPNVKPEAEAQFFSSAIDTAKDAYKYGLFNPVTAQNANIRFSNLGRDIVQHGDYYAGSIGASALMWLTPAVAVKGAKALVDVVRLSGIEKNFVKPLQAAVKDENALIKLDKDGIINIGKESDSYRYGIGRVTTVPMFEKTFTMGDKSLTVSSSAIRLNKPAVEFFTRTPVTDRKFIVPTKRTTGYSSTFVDLDTGPIPVRLLKKDATKSGVTVTKTGDVFEMTEVLAGRDPVALKVPKYEKTVATSETFIAKEFKDLLADDTAVAKILGREPTATRVTKADKTTTTTPMSPFTESIQQVQKAETQVTKEFLKDMGIIKDTSKTAAGKGPSVVNPLVGFEKGFENVTKIVDSVVSTEKDPFSLGLGGATGVERKRAKDAAKETSVYDVLAYPDSKVDLQTKDVSSLMSQTSIINGLGSGRNVEKILSLDTTTALKTSLDSFAKFSESLLPKDILQTSQDTSVRTDAALDAMVKQMQDLLPTQKQMTRVTTTTTTADVNILRTPDIFKGFRFDLPDFGGFKLADRKKRRKTKRVDRKFKITDILDFSRLFDPPE